ncbi:citrate synthase-like protein [Pyronema omphalodes]|nr:citrate synthase-like protein [Pyronema omphalodes]
MAIQNTPNAVKNNQTITVTDNRTGKTITIPITNNSIPATAFKALKTVPALSGDSIDTDDTSNGLRVFDPAFLNTAAISSKITFIDGDRGFLMHRGYPIEQLASKSDFLETAYLLIYGVLPDKKQDQTWRYEIMHHTALAEDVMKVISSMRYDSHPMSVFITAIAAMGAFAPEANPALQGRDLYTSNADVMNKNIIRILGKAGTVAAASMRVRMNRPFIPPRSDYSYCENLLYMMDSHSEAEGYKPDQRLVKALDTLFILHADHEMNCSTATMTHVGSSLVDPYSAVAAAAAALYGPLHGGANEAVIRMIERIGSVEAVPEFLEKVKRKEELLFGFGHRVYRNTDPRSKIIREVAEMVFEACGREPLIEVATALRDAALKDEFFVKRRLYPNVDFWSGLIYKAMGFPLDFFPILFAVPRVAGWLAHWKQLLDHGNGKIWRPRQIYVGEGLRDYVPMEKRPERKVETHADGVLMLPHYQSKRRLGAKL